MRLPKKSLSLLILFMLFLAVAVLHACAPSSISYAKVTPLKPTSMVIFASMTRDFNGKHGKLNIYMDVKGFPNSLTPTPSSGEENYELIKDKIFFSWLHSFTDILLFYKFCHFLFAVIDPKTKNFEIEVGTPPASSLCHPYLFATGCTPCHGPAGDRGPWGSRRT